MDTPLGSGRTTRRDLLISAVLFVVSLAYISSFWGKLATWLPAPLDRWSHGYRFLLGPWWREHVMPGSPLAEQKLVMGAVIGCALAVVLPACLLRLSRIKLSDVGLAWPNTIGMRWILVSVVLSVPFGWWLYLTGTHFPERPWANLRFICRMLLIFAEHFLVCGVMVAVLLPARRLPSPVLAPLEGPWWQRGLRWLGLAQPRPTPQRNRVLAWFGLDGTTMLVLLASGVLFWTAHAGKRNIVEVVLSLPGGVAVAYLTLRARSIWPAVIAHWSMNLIPLGVLALLR